MALDWSDTGEYLLSGYVIFPRTIRLERVDTYAVFFWLMLKGRARAFDGKAKVWSVEQRVCVATHTETDKTLWAVRWLPKTGRSEYFVTAGAGRNVAVYREATGG